MEENKGNQTTGEKDRCFITFPLLIVIGAGILFFIENIRRPTSQLMMLLWMGECMLLLQRSRDGEVNLCQRQSICEKRRPHPGY